MKTAITLILLAQLTACGGDDGQDDPERPGMCQAHPEACK